MKWLKSQIWKLSALWWFFKNHQTLAFKYWVLWEWQKVPTHHRTPFKPNPPDKVYRSPIEYLSHALSWRNAPNKCSSLHVCLGFTVSYSYRYSMVWVWDSSEAPDSAHTYLVRNSCHTQCWATHKTLLFILTLLLIASCSHEQRYRGLPKFAVFVCRRTWEVRLCKFSVWGWPVYILW